MHYDFAGEEGEAVSRAMAATTTRLLSRVEGP